MGAQIVRGRKKQLFSLTALGAEVEKFRLQALCIFNLGGKVLNIHFSLSAIMVSDTMW